MSFYNPSMDVTPDTKDWTWVLERPCPECGFDTRQVRREDIPRIIRDVAAEWEAVLARPDDVHTRPQHGVWSPLEYGCHVRDVFRLFDARLQRMLSEDDPLFANWDQNSTAIAERYWEHDPESVSANLRGAADQLAKRFEGVQGDTWQRPGTRSDGTHFTIETFGRYLVHDPLHHIWDVTGRRQDHV